MKRWLPILALVVTLTAFSCGMMAEFLNWDDQAHYFENPDVIHFSWATLPEPFRHLVNKIYIPLSTLSFALEYKLFGPAPFAAHLINLILHLCNVWLVYRLAQKMRLGDLGAFTAALFFGVHPMHVESVMWVTERKDVLYSAFYLLSLNCYWDYLEDRGAQKRGLALFFFTASMLAKPMALSLPLVLLLLDWFARGRIDRTALVEKGPFFAVAVMIGAMSYWFNARVPFTDLARAPLIWIWSFSFYIFKFFVPTDLSPLYYLPGPVSYANPAYLLSIALFLFAAAHMIFSRHKWSRFALFYYFLSIFFLLRFDATADKSVVADRFMYLPSLGICLALGVLIGRTARKAGGRTTVAVLFALFLLLSIQTYRQCGVWRNSMTLWNRVIALYPHEAKGYSYRANAHIARGNYPAAMADLDRAIALDREDHEALFQKGWVLFRWGLTQDALQAFDQCLSVRPDNARALNARGIIYMMKSRRAEAIMDLTLAHQLMPRDASIAANLKQAQQQENQAAPGK